MNDSAHLTRALVDSLEDVEACPICGKKSREIIYVGEAFRGGINLEVVICKYCTHIYLSKRPSVEAYQTFYSEDLYRKFTAKSKKRNYDDIKARYSDSAYRSKRAEHGRRLYDQFCTNLLNKGDIVFDFGAGDGAWLHGLQENSKCYPAATEPSSFFVDLMREQLSGDIYQGSIEFQKDFLRNKYKERVKMVIISGSLQHMVDPVDALITARNIISEGYLYICNWAIDHHTKSNYITGGKQFKEIITVDHPHYFHESSYKYMVERLGFEIIKFNFDSKVRARHMEIFAKKGNCNIDARPNKTYKEILEALELNDKNVRGHRSSLRYRLKKFIKSRASLCRKFFAK